MEGSFQFNPDASPFIPSFMTSFEDKALDRHAESSSKGDFSLGTSVLSQIEEHDFDQVAQTTMVSSMFPNVSTDFIHAILKANGYDINLTMDMIHELNSPDMVHDDAELDLPTFPDNKELQSGQSVSGVDNHHTEVPESTSNLNQAPQDEKSATTSGVKPGVSDDDKSVPTNVAE